MKWQPIETAPKDETRILTCGSFTSNGKPSIRISYWNNGARKQGWKDEALGFCPKNPTHWMPLPEAPLGELV